MTRPLTVAAVIGLVAFPAAAQVTEEQKTALVAAIEAENCRVTAENNARILAAAGLAEADAATVVQALLEAGIAVIENGQLVLISANCP